jgi:Flp pilus assembly protein TadG
MRLPPRPRRHRGGERGAVALELVVLTPVLVMALWLVGVFAMRMMLADAQVDSAARDAARAATIARTPRAAQAAAAEAAAATLAQAKPQCQAVHTLTDTRGFGPGGSVQVTVRCVLRLGDLGLLGLGSTRTVSKTYLAPVDVFRAVGP